MAVIQIDFDTAEVSKIESGNVVAKHPFTSQEGFDLASQGWLRVGWDVKNVYQFTWLGRPIIQLPEDMLRLQEVIFTVKPDVIIECGVAHGGALVFYSSLCRMMGKGRVIGIDIEIRKHNRVAIEAHPMVDRITLVEASSIAPETIAHVRSLVKPGETVMLCLDSNHLKDHVLAEMEGYGPMVTPGSYIVSMDGIMELVAGGPRTKPDWGWNNPKQASLEFAKRHPEFEIVDPPFLFNEGLTARQSATYWPCGYLRRKDS
jgi:cephalosporin hydroxylase